jgi:hypothetical protein
METYLIFGKTGTGGFIDLVFSRTDMRGNKIKDSQKQGTEIRALFTKGFSNSYLDGAIQFGVSQAL